MNPGLGPPCAGVVDVCLIPEVPFELDSLLDHVAKIVDKRGHVVICTAEGAGQARYAQSAAPSAVRCTGPSVFLHSMLTSQSGIRFICATCQSLHVATRVTSQL